MKLIMHLQCSVFQILTKENININKNQAYKFLNKH